jgi:membrane protease YdiL (CAAX protease family)
MFIEKTYTKNNNSFTPIQIAVSIIIALICLTLSLVFPAQGGFETVTKNVFFLVAVPALYIKYILKGNLAYFGLNLQNKKAGLIWGIITFAVLVALAAFYTRLPNFQTNYNLPGGIVNNFWYFLLYELVFVNIFLFVYEFFFRGFILFILSEKIGFWAIFAQTIIFWLSLIATKNFTWSFAPTIILPLTSGFLAYKGRSFVYSYAVAIIFTILLDAYLIRSIR